MDSFPDVGKSDTGGVCKVNVCSVVMNRQLIEARMFPDQNRELIAVTVLYGIGDRFFGNADKTVLDILRNNVAHIIFK